MKTSQLKAKKSLGQHFLVNEDVARRIVESFAEETANSLWLEVGPGKGVLTKYLIEKNDDLYCCEIDERMAIHISKLFKIDESHLYRTDILELNFQEKFSGQKVSVIGNFPYNISSQILFHVLDFKNQVPVIVGMFQKEMAMRVAAKHGKKDYGVISVLMQAYYDIDYLFDVVPDDFDPPPKVFSGVIKLKLKSHPEEILHESLFKRIVKNCFQQRRKMIRNTLNEFFSGDILAQKRFDKRPEQLSVSDFIALANEVFEIQNQNK